MLLSLGEQEPPAPLIWSAELAHHVALVTAHNLLRAIRNAEGRFTPISESMSREVELLRNLHEHWDEQWRSFYNVENPGPLKRSGRGFASLHPGESPYWWLGWSSAYGPQLGPGLHADPLHGYLDKLQREVLEAAPQLACFITTPAPSPWLGPEFDKDRWWPKSPT